MLVVPSVVGTARAVRKGSGELVEYREGRWTTEITDTRPPVSFKHDTRIFATEDDKLWLYCSPDVLVQLPGPIRVGHKYRIQRPKRKTL